MLKNRFNGCHGNHAFFHSAIEFIFEDKNSLHFLGSNERFGTHEKLSCGGCKVGQISSRGKCNGMKGTMCPCPDFNCASCLGLASPMDGTWSLVMKRNRGRTPIKKQL